MEKSLSRAWMVPETVREKLKEALSEKYGLAMTDICVGNGASDLIFRTVFALRPKQALVLAPTLPSMKRLFGVWMPGLNIIRSITKISR